jgi:hypothetical protein
MSVEGAAPGQRVRDVPLDVGIDRLQERGIVLAEEPVVGAGLLDELVGDRVRRACHGRGLFVGLGACVGDPLAPG